MNVKNPEKRQVQIKILDHEFAISTDASDDRVQKTQTTINETLNEIKSKSKTLSSQHLMILAALNLTERLIDLEEKHKGFKSTVAKKSKKILGMIEV